MKRTPKFAKSWFLAALLVACGQAAFAQDNQGSSGVVDDWTTHHVIFSNPGTLEDAIRNGTYEKWHRIVTDPRYRMQWTKRYGIPPEESTAADAVRVLGPRLEPSQPRPPHREPHMPAVKLEDRSSLNEDWSISLEPGSNGGVGPGKYPAKYTFSPIGAPSCTTDYVVFPINIAGSNGSGMNGNSFTPQANLIGLNNLYSGFCTTGSVPTFQFAYYIGTGTIATSPVLSLDGTQVAFVETITNGSRFHVLKLGTNGNSGCSTSGSVTPCNGNGFSSPATPGTLNNASDTPITLSGNVTDSAASPFVDYQHDTAYVSDNTGKLHKFTPVFNGTLAEVTTSPWPVTVASGVQLTGPIFDGGTSQNILVGGINGKLYCITSAGVACSTASITVGTGAIVEAPIVDSTQETVFTQANNTTTGFAVLTQATTSLGSPVSANMGFASSATNGTTDLFDGALDNAYFTSSNGTGYMYFCGNLSTAATPALLRVLITAGKMSSSNDGNIFQLVITNNAGTSNDCTPLTEIYNPTQGIDWLFLSVKGPGFATIANGGTAPNGTPSCNYTACAIGFSLPTAAPPNTFPTAASGAVTTNLTSQGLSGIIVDNVSTTPGASNLYFGNIGAGTGVQYGQSGLQ
jgi:hypothetical protein